MANIDWKTTRLRAIGQFTVLIIRRKFGPNPLLREISDIIKSAQTALRFHAPTQGVGLRYQLHRLGFHALLLDESSTCPDCFGNTKQTSLKRINPRPRRRQFGKSSTHGLLECESVQCKTDCGWRTKKWNRDPLAVCNSRRVWDAYMNGGERPDDLKVQRHGHEAVGGRRILIITDFQSGLSNGRLSI